LNISSNLNSDTIVVITRGGRWTIRIRQK